MMQRSLPEHHGDEREWAEAGSRLSAQSVDQPLPHVRALATGDIGRGGRSAIGYGLLGFLLGAVFWHFVGFWDFLGQLMFKGNAASTEIVQGAPTIKLKERVSGVSAIAVVASPEACTMLRLDRNTGETAALPCEGESLPLRGIKPARREDLRVTASQRLIETTARGWGAVKIEPPGATVDEANAE